MPDDDVCDITKLPTEILLLIFTRFSARELTRFREVCTRFKQIVDGLNKSDILWRDYCRTDFSNVYKNARSKSRDGLLWYHVYRSLSLWKWLDSAREVRDEFASASRVLEEIRDFQILRDGIIGVHKRGCIAYYDIETLQPSKRGPISGDYMRYTENEEAIVILNYHLHLFIMRKYTQNPLFESNITIDNVKTYLVVNKKVFYVNLNDEIFVCSVDGDLTNKLIKRSFDSVMCLGYTNCLHVLTFEREIFTVIGNKLVLSCKLVRVSNLLHTLNEYNFLETLDWRVYFQWMYVLKHTVPEGPLRDIVTIRSYGDVYFVGSNWGVLRIYYSPYSSSGELDLFHSEPVKQYNFMERYDVPVLSMCPILQVDVLECEDGHTVVVAMPKKIAILNFLHNFKRTATDAMLPFSDAQTVKVLKISETDN